MMDKEKGVLYINDDQLHRMMHSSSQAGNWSAISAVCIGLAIGSAIPAILQENILWLVSCIPLGFIAKYAVHQENSWQKTHEHVIKEIREEGTVE
jgi:hypothetical protein